MRFASPWLLLFGLAIPLYWFLKYIGVRGNKIGLTPTLKYSSTSLFPKHKTRLARVFDLTGDILLSAALALLIVALARPQGGQDITTETAFGVDIILAMDVSGSMLSVDTIPENMPHASFFGQTVYYDPLKKLYDQNRLNSAKRVIGAYIDKQEYNRIGVVLFAGYSYTKCPLTLDKEMLKTIMDDVNYRPDNDGTAIGMGIATCINRLKKSTAASKLIILLTDGINNTGMIDPITAANIAREMNIRIYTIGVGNPEGALAPNNQELTQYVLDTKLGFDADSLMKIAEITGGKFYHASDPQSLEQIYNDIDRLEKSRFDIQRRVLYTENFLPWLIAGFIVFAGYIAFSQAVIKIP